MPKHDFQGQENKDQSTGQQGNENTQHINYHQCPPGRCWQLPEYAWNKKHTIIEIVALLVILAGFVKWLLG